MALSRAEKDKKNADQRRRRRLIAYGRWEEPLVDPTRAREHINHLREWGLSYEAIGHLAGIHPDMIGQIMSETHSARRKTISRPTEAAILSAAFDLDDLLPDHQVDVCGTQRRIRALIRVGWSQGYIGNRLGVSSSQISLHLSPQTRYVTVSRAREIRDLYDKLSMKLGPSVQAVRWASNRNWPPPWAWDDETIDHPDTEPDLSCLTRPGKGGRRSSEEAFEDLLWVMEHHPLITRERLAERLGMTKDGISTLLSRLIRYRSEAFLEEHAYGPLTEEESQALAEILEPIEDVRRRLQDAAEIVHGHRGVSQEKAS